MDKEKVKVKKNKLDSTKSVKNSIDKWKIVELYFSKRLKEKSSVSAFKRLSSK